MVVDACRRGPSSGERWRALWPTGWRAAVLALAAASFFGPWTVGVATLFGLSMYESSSVAEMVWYLVQKIPASFQKSPGLFIGVPVLLVALRGGFPRWAHRLQALVLLAGMASSVATLPLLLVTTPGDARAAPHNVMGDIFVADLVTMYGWHLTLCFGLDEAVPAWTVLCGPLFGLCRYIWSETDARPNSLLGSSVAFYFNVGALYRGYKILEADGHDVFVHTVEFGEWRGYELYAAVNVIGGFLVICSSIPFPTSLSTFVDTLGYVVGLNGNIAAGWIASEGVYRPPLSVPAASLSWRYPFIVDAPQKGDDDPAAAADGGAHAAPPAM